MILYDSNGSKSIDGHIKCIYKVVYKCLSSKNIAAQTEIIKLISGNKEDISKVILSKLSTNL